MSTDTPPSSLSSKLAILSALLAVVVGSMVLTGWAFDVAVLKSISPGWVSMKVNTALCFILTGIALLLTTRPPAIFNHQHPVLLCRLAHISSLLVVLFSALTLYEYVFAWNSGIDQWLFVEPAGTVGTSNPGRMAPETALCFLLLATALWVNCVVPKTRLTVLTSVSCGLLVLALALAAMQSYFTPGLGPFGWFGLTIMAMHTAILFALLGMSVIAISWQQNELPWSFSKRTSVALACSLILLVFIGLNANRSQFQLKEINRQIIYGEKVSRDVDNLLIEVIDAHTRVRGYVITGNEQFKARYLESKASNMAKLDALRKFIAANPQQQQQFARLAASVKDDLDWLRLAIDSERISNTPAVRNTMVVHGEELLKNLRSTVDQITFENQQAIRQLRQEEKNVAGRSFLFVTTGTLASLLIFLIVIFRLNFAVHERKLAEAQLQKLNKFLQSIVENVPGVVFWKDLNLRFLGCNTQCAQYAGHLTPDELIGKTDFDMGWSAQAELYRADDKEVIESGEPKLSYEELRTTADGKIFWVRTSKAPLRDESDQIIGIIGASQDITEHKLAEDRLRESEQRYRFLFENMLEGYAYCKMLFEQDTPLDFIYLNVNEAFGKVTGLKEVIGKKVTELIPGIRASSPELFEIYGRVALSGQPEKIETYVEGLGIWLAIAVYSPQKEYFVAVFDDITERKRAEEALMQSEASLRMLVEHSPVAMIVDVGIDADEKIIMMNQKFTGLFGYTMAEVPDVAHWWPLAYPDEKYREEVKSEWIAKVSQAIQSHSDIEPMETKVCCKDGAIRYIRLSLSSIGERNIITFEDLTKRRLAESRLNEQLDELRRWQEATMGREERILELKREINGMLLKAGQPPRYLSVEQ